MADDRVIIRLGGIGEARVRYHRAVLTIAQSGDLNGDRLGLAIAEYERGEIGPEELASAFIKARVRKHSPSFNWEDADLARVLKLVVESSEDPKFTSSKPEEVAAVLVEAARIEAEQLKEAMAKMHRALRPWFGSDMARALNIHKQAISFPLLDALRTKSSISDALIGDAFKKHSQMSNNLIGKLDLTAGINADIKKIADLGLRKTIAKSFGQDYIRMQKHLTEGLIPKIEFPNWISRMPMPTKVLDDFAELGRSFIESYKLALPPNWRELDHDQLAAAVKLSEDGLSLAWAPREEIILELIAAQDHDAICRVLESRRAEIVEDVQAVLEQIVRDDLVVLVAGCQEAINAYSDGYPGAAQSHAATVLGTIAHGPLGGEDFEVVRQLFPDQNPMHDVGITQLPLVTAGRAFVRALVSFDEAGDVFNRNLTAHKLGDHFSEAQLLTGLLLMVGFLRGLQPALHQQDARELEAAA